MLIFGGEGAHVSGMVGCLGVDLSKLCHGGLLFNYTKFLEPGVETVGLGKSGTNNVRVGIMNHCYAQDVRVRIWVDRGWVIVVVACTNCDMHSAVLISPIGI